MWDQQPSGKSIKLDFTKVKVVEYLNRQIEKELTNLHLSLIMNLD